MRLDLLARRAFTIAVGLVIAVTVAACGSGSSSSAGTRSSSASSSSTTSSPPATGTATTGSAGAITQVKANWEEFFNGKTPSATKVSLLQNGQKYATVIKAQAGSALAGETAAKVTAAVLNSATTATVSYDITLNGTTALPNQTGTAVLEGSVWKVGDVSFCNLLKLENNGTAPAVCSG